MLKPYFYLRARLLAPLAILACLIYVPANPRGAWARVVDVPVIQVTHPADREVNDSLEFRGRIQPAMQVDLRPRISGQLLQTFFKEGDHVERGDLLFQIDPKPLQEELDQSLRKLNEKKQSLARARAVLERDRTIEARQPGTIAKAQLDLQEDLIVKAHAEVRDAENSVEMGKAKLALTRIHAPMDGLVVLKLADPGRRLIADQTHLGMIVSREPLYVYFDVARATLDRIRAATGARQPRSVVEADVEMGLVDDLQYPHAGKVSLPDWKGQPGNSTVRLRATFTRLQPAKGARPLLPDTLVSMRVPVDAAFKSLVVPSRSLVEQKNAAAVYVVDAANRIQVRQVRTGPVFKDGNTAIRSGLTKTDWVVLQPSNEIGPGSVVRPDRSPDSIAPAAPHP
jgi:membrane fusion protein, multidrug efflux system